MFEFLRCSMAGPAAPSRTTLLWDAGGMTTNEDRTARIAELRRHEEELVFESFDNTDAWRLGSLIAQRGLDAGHRIAIDIRRPGLILFRAALPGSTADQEAWIQRKSASAFRFESSTALLGEQFAANGVDPSVDGWLDPTQYSTSGGAFPVRVAGAGVVAVVTVSGLASDDDHQLVVDSIAEYLAAGSR